MAQPTSSTTIQRPELGELAYEYMMGEGQGEFIGSKVLPFKRVTEKKADYPVIPTESILKVPDTKRALSGDYNRGNWEFTTGTYNCEEYGWEEPVSDAEQAFYAYLFDIETAATEIAVDHILRAHEKRVASLLFNTGTFSNGAVSTEWSTAASATPQSDVNDAKATMKTASGLLPDTMVISDKVLRNLMETTEIKNATQSVLAPSQIGTEMAQVELLKNHFGLKNLFIGKAVEDSATEGQASSLSDIWDDEYCLLCHVGDGGESIRRPTLGRTFIWSADAPSPVVVESYRDEPRRQDIVRARNYVDEALIYSAAGYLLTNITA